jgi:hypothetical protein
MISIELTGDTACWFEPEVASHAAKAVFHYFKIELRRQCVTAEEFAAAMERVLRGLNVKEEINAALDTAAGVVESDLCRLAREAGDGCELVFFPRLRKELRQHLQQSPRILRFRGLRPCVKQIAGARRWTPQCRRLEEQIVGFLRECAGVESVRFQFALVVQ